MITKPFNKVDIQIEFGIEWEKLVEQKGEEADREALVKILVGNESIFIGKVIENNYYDSFSYFNQYYNVVDLNNATHRLRFIDEKDAALYLWFLWVKESFEFEIVSIVKTEKSQNTVI